MTKLRTALLASICVCAWLPAAHAADLPTKKAPPEPVAVDIFDPWQIRIRGLGILPQGNGNINQLPYNHTKIGDSIIPEIDISYYFTRNIAVEAICCFSKNNVYVTGIGGAVANTWLFPPTVMAQWHFTNFGAFQPYIGVGVNYTYYFDTKTENALAGTSMHIDNSWGVAGQIGFDYMFNRHWGVNVDVKKVLMQPNWYIQETPFARLTGRAEINPWIVGAGITYRFGGPDLPGSGRFF